MASRRQGAKDLGAALAEAAALVKGLPPDLRAAAFSKAVDVLLGAPSAGSPEPASAGAQGTTSQERPDLLATIDRTAHPDMYKRTKVVDRSLIVLRAARDDAGVEWLSAGDVTRVLREKFRLPVRQNAVQMALSRASQLVDRRRNGSTFEYRLMSPGEAYLEHNTNSLVRPAKARTHKSANVEALVDSEASEESAAEKTTRNPKRAPKAGPTVYLDKLLLDGFFTDDRTIGEIVDHLAHKKALRYKTTDISPVLTRMVRAGKLDRELGPEKQYVYRTHRNSVQKDPYLEGITRKRNGK